MSAEEGKGMLAELREDAFGNGVEIIMPDIIKMVKPFVKPAHKQLAMELGADDKMFLIRKVLSEDEEKLAAELSVKIAALRKIEQFHIDIIPLEKQRGLLGTICFYVVETASIKEFELTEAPKVEFPITNPETLITGLITGELWKIDKSL